MARTTALTPMLVPLTQVHIGSLINDPIYPFQDHFIVAPAEHRRDYFDSPSNSFNRLLSKSHGTNLHGQLTTLVSGAFKWTHEVSIKLNSLTETLYEMNAPIAWFERLCGEVSTRQWLHKRVSAGSEIFLIAGLRTLTNLEVGSESKHERAAEFDAKVSGDAVITSLTGVPIDTGGTLDAGAETKFSKGDKTEVSFSQVGEFVYGIHYRRVKFSWVSRDKVSTAKTDRNNIWIDLTQPRLGTTSSGSASLNEQKLVMIEANLSDQLGIAGGYVLEDDEDLFVMPDVG